MKITFRRVGTLAAAVAVALIALVAANVGDIRAIFASPAAPPAPAFEVKLGIEGNHNTGVLIFPYHSVPGWSNVLKLEATAYINGAPATGSAATYTWEKKSWNQDGTVKQDWFALTRRDGARVVHALQPGNTRSWRAVATNSATGEKATSNELTTTWIDQAPFDVVMNAIIAERNKTTEAQVQADAFEDDVDALEGYVETLKQALRDAGLAVPAMPPAPAPATPPTS